MHPAFLSIEQVLYIHEQQIREFGGLHGLRDIRLLESAIAMPSAGFGGEFLHRSLHEQAAAYLFHIVQNHPFLDGNKRTGAHVVLVFLELNGRRLECGADEFYQMVLSVAEGKLGKEGITRFLDEYTVAN